MKVRLIAKTQICNEELIKDLQDRPGPEDLIMYTARVSSPNQTSSNPKLLKYCAEHGHVSVFEMADATFEIITSRAISAQILRHKSFCFQELSQRYAAVQAFEFYEARRQDTKNRQNSIDDMSEEDLNWFTQAQNSVIENSVAFYEEALQRGIAKEQARMLLPLSTQTKLYMKGTLRSWIHYIAVRADPATQLEHREIAIEIRRILSEEFPIIAEAVGWVTK
jgi:thymidylate synthase (FAD)